MDSLLDKKNPPLHTQSMKKSLSAVNGCVLKIVFCTVACIAPLFGSACDGCASKTGVCFVVDDSAAESVIKTAALKEVRFFFDRTDSMQGFTRREADTEYAKALPIAWDAAERLFGKDGFSEKYYEFGETLICELPFAAVQNEIRRPDFYGFGYDYTKARRRGRIVKESGGQSFGSLVQYIKENSLAPDVLNVAVTDLYEKNMATQYFRQFFQNAFDKGLSCAFFAVESAFRGNINDISSDSAQNIRGVDGYSTFFIFIAGGSAPVREYSETLGNDLRGKNLKFNDSLFIIGSPARTSKAYIITPKLKMAGNERLFESEKYKYAMVNLNSIKLKKWNHPLGEADTAKKQKPSFSNADAAAYRLITETGSRYAAWIPIEKTDNSEFEFDCDITAEYFDGTGTPPGEPSPFIAYEKPLGNTIKPVVLHGDEIAEEIKTDADLEPGKHYICLALEIVNKNLAKGYYKIGCNIALKAKVPDWVEERDAAGPAELRQSNRQGELLRVMNLKPIYSGIDDVYNKTERRSVYSGFVYFEKFK